MEINKEPAQAQTPENGCVQPELSVLLPVRDETVNIGIMLKLLTAFVETPHEVRAWLDRMVTADEGAAA